MKTGTGLGDVCSTESTGKHLWKGVTSPQVHTECQGQRQTTHTSTLSAGICEVHIGANLSRSEQRKVGKACGIRVNM